MFLKLSKTLTRHLLYQLLIKLRKIILIKCIFGKKIIITNNANNILNWFL